MRKMIQRLFASSIGIADRVSVVANRNYLPWTDQYLEWLKRPLTWFLFAALGAALAGVGVAPQGWLVCAVLLLLAVIGTVWPILAMHGIKAELKFERSRCYEFETNTASVSITNRWPWPVWGLLVDIDSSYDESNEDRSATALARIPAWSTSSFQFRFVPTRRGLYPTRTPMLSTGFPFGIWSSSKAIATVKSLLVWPQVIDLQHHIPPGRNEWYPEGGLVDRIGGQGDVMATRSYLPGDSRRNVHWIHTARRDSLIVCERQQAERRKVTVVLDQGSFDTQSELSSPELDWSLRVVASFCREFHRKHWELTCELGDVQAAVPPGPTGLSDLFDRLAQYQPSRHPTSASSRSTRSAANNSFYLVITSANGMRQNHTSQLLSRGRTNAQAVVLSFDEADVVTSSKADPQSSRSTPCACLHLDFSNATADNRHRELERQLQNAAVA